MTVMVLALRLLVQVYYRVEWAKFQERERKKEEEEKEKERVAYAQIDWHDFVVVETVDFQPNEQGIEVKRCNLYETLLPLSRGCVLKCRFQTDIGSYSCISFKDEGESLLVTVCRAGFFSGVSNVLLARSPGLH